MRSFIQLASLLRRYKFNLSFTVLFQLLTAIMTVISIPLVIPFFQILFSVSPSSYPPPTDYYDLESVLNYGFSRLIAISDKSTALTFVSICVVVVFLLRNVFRYFASFFLIHARNGVVSQLRSSIYSSFSNLSYSRRTEYKKGHLLSLISNDINEVDHGILVSIELLFKTPLIVIGSLTFMIMISPQMSMIAFGLVLFMLIIVGRLSRYLKRQSIDLQERKGDVVTISDEILTSTKLVNAYGANDMFLTWFDKLNETIWHLSDRMLKRRDMASPLTEFLAVVTVVVLLYYGSKMVFTNQLQPTTFFAFIFAFYNLIEPAKNFSREYFNVQKAFGAYQRISNFIDENKAETNGESKLELLSFENAITFQNVSLFLKGNQEPILNQVSFSINKGEKIAIVGPSGAGKTTIIDALLGFYPLDSGEILVDNVNIKQYSTSTYRSLFGLVTQDAHLFHTSIKENIILNSSTAKANNFDQVARVTMVNDIVSSKSMSYDTSIGDMGIKLSGGEKQKIAVARALIRDPQVLLLDEPTSSLDSDSELQIRNLVLNSINNKTTLIITHNLNLLKSVDNIIVVIEGRVVEMGSYEELVQKKGKLSTLLKSYNHLYES